MIASDSAARLSGAAYAAFITFAGISSETIPAGADNASARSKNTIERSG